DPAAIAEVRAGAWPDVRDADELADTLHTLIALPEDFEPPEHRTPAEAWQSWFETLRQSNRATRVRIPQAVSSAGEGACGPNPIPEVVSNAGEDARGQAQDRRSVPKSMWSAAAPGCADTTFWVSAEKAKAFRMIYPTAQFEDQLPEISGEEPLPDDALKAMVTGWLTHLGPTTASALAVTLDLPVAEMEKTLLRIESTGLILRGQFTRKATAETPAPAGAAALAGVEWCERRLLARIHRLTLGSLRKQIEPVTAATFMRWLFRWQRVAPGAQTRDEHGTLQVLRRLQGFEVPASAWERQVLGRRISNYDPKFLDQLSLTGAVGWGRLSPHPAMLEDSTGSGRRVVPTSVAPITFFVRD